MAEYGPWTQQRGRDHCGGGRPRCAALQLHALQAEFGCVAKDAVPMIAAALNITRAEMNGIVTFNHDLRDHRPGGVCCAMTLPPP
jgi:formate dehydrogenase subunit gamma